MNQGSREELELLYPWYKEEVFRRRERMMWLTASASGVLVLSLVVVHVFAAPTTSPTIAVLVCLGVVLFSGIMAYLIVQQQARHLMAKQVLINIERELGLYEKGRHLEDAALYPEEWQTAWRRDVSVVIYLAVLAGLTGLVIAAVLWR
ncbi:MAG TPA: hypothetical protein VGQ60_05920 [Nitrospiraceae bacterium]|jgi:hypothetical protein|nr:hypothetical protein [Nitrospiraceae bacterium]